jgi:hypothetical protein
MIISCVFIGVKVVMRGAARHVSWTHQGLCVFVLISNVSGV